MARCRCVIARSHMAVAVLNTGDRFHADATPDGLTQYGVFETNTRPGYLDNSHVGNNGRPTRAWIGTKEVYIDVTHGCSRDMAMSRCEQARYHVLRVLAHQGSQDR